MKYKIYGESVVPNLPWEEKPAGSNAPFWRFSGNPVIKRYPAEGLARVFNSAVLPYQGGFIGVFRSEGLDGDSSVYLGRSANGIDWDIEKERICFVDRNGKYIGPCYGYDPRLIKIEDRYYFVFCGGFEGPTVDIAVTEDFKTFTLLPHGFLPCNRNGVLFPRKVDGKFLMLNRPCDNRHTDFGDIFLSKSPDLLFWGDHKLVMRRRHAPWQNVKIGAGCAPIETSEGWLIFYHGVAGPCNGFVYSMGAALLDLDDPSKVLYNCKRFLLTPETPYEECGFVPNVVFPCAAVTDAATGRIAVYYGAADSYVAVAFSTVDIVIDYIKAHA